MQWRDTPCGSGLPPGGTDAGAASRPDGWLAEWLAAGALTPVVVRREATECANMLPVGIRGSGRHQRQAAYLFIEAVLRITRPEALVPGAVCAGHGLLPRAAARYRACSEPEGKAAAQHSQYCALGRLQSALVAIAPALNSLGLPWGPTGGLGFALATGLPVVHPGSDLDLVVRAPKPLTQSQVQALAAAVQEGDCRVDLQIDTGHAGFSFNEWLSSARRVPEPGNRRGRILLKTNTGPLLVNDPWQAHSSQTCARGAA